MALIKSRLKRTIPWWIKIAFKLLLSRLPISKKLWQKIGIFVPGQMINPDYAINIFLKHFNQISEYLPNNFSYLELGPGDSLGTSVIAWAFGACQGYLIDAGAYACKDIGIYKSLINKLLSFHISKDILPLLNLHTINEILNATNCKYFNEGLISLKSIPSNSIDFVVSNAVLEHIKLIEFEKTIKELYRIQKPGSYGSHTIDFKDHLSGRLNNLRFSPKLWESSLFAKSGFYTNRLRPSVVISSFENVGFSIINLKKNIWPKIPTYRDKMHPSFQKYSDMDLKISSMNLLVEKG